MRRPLVVLIALAAHSLLAEERGVLLLYFLLLPVGQETYGHDQSFRTDYGDRARDGAQVIQIATLNSAKVMGLDREAGSIEAGKRADMILVEGNPLEDFSTLRRVQRVISSGRVFNPADLWKSVGFKP